MNKKIIEFTYKQLISANVHIGNNIKFTHPSTYNVLLNLNEKICFFDLIWTVGHLKTLLYTLRTLVFKRSFIAFINIDKYVFKLVN